LKQNERGQMFRQLRLELLCIDECPHSAVAGERTAEALVALRTGTVHVPWQAHRLLIRSSESGKGPAEEYRARLERLWAGQSSDNHKDG
jgi:hypothetical protein